LLGDQPRQPRPEIPRNQLDGQAQKMLIRALFHPQAVEEEAPEALFDVGREALDRRQPDRRQKRYLDFRRLGSHPLQPLLGEPGRIASPEAVNLAQCRMLAGIGL
jgi:hypothetical protein